MIKTTPSLTSTQFGVLTRHMGLIKPENLKPQARPAFQFTCIIRQRGFRGGKVAPN